MHSNPNAILRTPAAALYLSLSESTLAHQRRLGEGPPHVALGPRAVGYRISDLDAWVLSRVRNSTADKPMAA